MKIDSPRWVFLQNSENPKGLGAQLFRVRLTAAVRVTLQPEWGRFSGECGNLDLTAIEPSSADVK